MCRSASHCRDLQQLCWPPIIMQFGCSAHAARQPSRCLGTVPTSRSAMTMPSLSSALHVAAAAASVQLRTERGEQLIWLHVLGRLLVAAGQLLQQVPQYVAASGACALEIDAFPELKQFVQCVQVTQALMLTVTAFGMFGVLGQGEAAATAAPGGILVAATQADLAQLLQQATGLQQQVTDVQALFKQSFDYSVQGMQAEGRLTRVQAMQQLHAACKEGGLPQQLCSFGEAYCAAFPQHGCCGNPACINLEKFTEATLASRGCLGCGKVSVIRLQWCRADGHAAKLRTLLGMWSAKTESSNAAASARCVLGVKMCPHVYLMLCSFQAAVKCLHEKPLPCAHGFM